MRFCKIFLFLAFFLPSIASADILTGLQGYWTLDEVSGPRFDSTSNNNDLTDNNTVSSATGVIGLGADFETSNSEYLSITNAAQTGLSITGAWSSSAWIKLESLNIYQEIIVKRTVSSGWNGYSTRVDDENHIQSLNFSTASNVTATDSGTLSTGTWYFVTSVYSGTTLKTYINGVQVASTNTTLSPTANTDPFNIGGYHGALRYADAVIDEVGIWNRALTTDEITELYNGGAGLAYPFSTEEEPVIPVFDFSGPPFPTATSTTDCEYTATSTFSCSSTYSTAPMETVLGTLAFGISIVIVILSVFFFSFVYSMMSKRKKPWQK